MSGGTHLCHARGCDRRIAVELFMCRDCNLLVPEDIRRRLLKRHPDVEARRDAIEAVAAARDGFRALADRQGELFGGAS